MVFSQQSSKNNWIENLLFFLFYPLFFLWPNVFGERNRGERRFVCEGGNAGRELSHLRDESEPSEEKTKRMKWQVEPASWKNRNGKTSDTGCMWAESWNVCLSEQIHACDDIRFEVSVKYSVRGTTIKYLQNNRIKKHLNEARRINKPRVCTKTEMFSCSPSEFTSLGCIF